MLWPRVALVRAVPATYLLDDDDDEPPPLLEAEPLLPLPEVPPVPESEELDDEVDLELPPPPGFTTVVLRSSQAASANAPSRTNINARIFMSSTPWFVDCHWGEASLMPWPGIALCGTPIATRSAKFATRPLRPTARSNDCSVLHADTLC
jgi:hypothetical protein